MVVRYLMSTLPGSTSALRLLVGVPGASAWSTASFLGLRGSIQPRAPSERWIPSTHASVVRYVTGRGSAGSMDGLLAQYTQRALAASGNLGLGSFAEQIAMGGGGRGSNSNGGLKTGAAAVRSTPHTFATPARMPALASPRLLTLPAPLPPQAEAEKIAREAGEAAAAAAGTAAEVAAVGAAGATVAGAAGEAGVATQRRTKSPNVRLST
jgi:hypothetical protein